jgi:glutamate synthase domain-containing protein 3
VLANFERLLADGAFVKVMPHDYKRVLVELAQAEAERSESDRSESDQSEGEQAEGVPA